MKQTILITLFLILLLDINLYSQESRYEAGLSLETYELPKNRSTFSNFSQSRYYNLFLSQENIVPTLAFNQKLLKKDRWRSLLVNTLYLFGSTTTNNLGSFGIPSPAHNPLINTLNNSNDYLLLQQHNFQRVNKLSIFIGPQGI